MEFLLESLSRTWSVQIMYTPIFMLKFGKYISKNDELVGKYKINLHSTLVTKITRQFDELSEKKDIYFCR